jgi:hypothetical protein
VGGQAAPFVALSVKRGRPFGSADLGFWKVFAPRELGKVISGVRACFSATLLAGYCRGVLAPVVRDESPVMALQRPGVRP